MNGQLSLSQWKLLNFNVGVETQLHLNEFVKQKKNPNYEKYK